MNQPRSDRLGRAVFALSGAFLAFALGLVLGMWQLFPANLVNHAYGTLRDMANYWQNDLGLVPTRHLVAAPPGRAAVRVADAAALAPGDRLVAGLMPSRSTLFAALLLAPDGRELHAWPVDYAALAPGHLKPQNVLLHGLQPMPDGSLVVAFDAGDVLARIEACGATRWATRGGFHHAVTLADDGTLWTLLDDAIAQVDAATGAVLRVIDIRKDLVDGKRLQGVFAIRTDERQDAPAWVGDPFHINDVEPLPAALAAAFPMFAPGDLLVSLRELNLVAVLDPASLDLKWWSHGPWHKQHDPDFQPDGSIAVYDNDMGFGASRIIKVFPATGRFAVALQGTEAEPFYNWRRGKHQGLANGNTLVVDAENGRVFEADPAGRRVWTYENVYDAGWNAIVTEGIQIPPGFFAPGALDCPR